MSTDSRSVPFDRTPFLAGAILSAMLVSVACSDGDSGTVGPGGDDGSARISLQPPTPILAAKAVDRSVLQLRIAVNGRTVQAEQQDDGIWLASVRIQRGREVTVSVVWLENMAGRLLGLASAEKTGQVGLASGVDSERLVFRSDEFDVSAATFDADDDGLSNLAERTAGTDPFDPADPGEPVTVVASLLEIRLPEILQEVEGLSVEVTVDGQLLELTLDGGAYRGSATVPANSSVFTRVRILRESVLLATFSRSADSGSGNAVVVNSGDFQIDGLDADGDGRSNAQEVAEGSDPNVSDPDPVEPDTVEPDTVEPGTVEPGTVEPDTVEPDPVEPDPVEPDPVEPDPVEPDTVEPDPVEPDPVKPDPAEPDPAEPDPVEPDPVEPDPVEPDPVEPDTVEPDTVEPDPVKPDPAEPDPAEPDPAEPDPAEPDPAEPDPVEPDPVEPDPVEPDTVEPDPVEPDTVEPDPVEPDPVEPDTVEPDPVEPDPVEPDTVEPGPVEPDTVEPGPLEPDTV